jgi:predicted nuclease with TOPRIM domain
MENNLNDSVKYIAHSVNRLIKLNAEADEKANQLQLENERLKEQLERKESELATLNKQYEALRMGEKIAGNAEDRDDLRKKVNELVREVDKCIALLND